MPIEYHRDEDYKADVYTMGRFAVKLDDYVVELEHYNCRAACADGCYLLPSEITTNECQHCGTLDIPKEILCLLYTLSAFSHSEYTHED